MSGKALLFGSPVCYYGWEEQNGIVALPEHNQYVYGGFSGSEGSFTVQSPHNGGGDSWLIWSDTSGQVLRERRYGGSGFDRIHNIVKAPDNSGDIIFVGSTCSPNDGTFEGWGLQEFGASDIWVARIDMQANIVWQNRVGTPFNEQGADIVVDNGGRITIAAEQHFAEDCSLWPFPPSEIWVFQLDANGNLLNSPKNFTHGEKNKPIALETTNDGGFMIVGETWPSLDFNNPIYEGNQFLYFKLNANLDEVYANVRGGGLQDSFLDVVCTNDNQFLLVGYTDANETLGWGDLDTISHGKEDLFLLKINQAGEEQWQKRYGGDELDWGYSAVQNQLGNYLVLGVSLSGRDSLGGKETGSLGGRDYWVLHLDEQGDRIWDQVLGGSGEDSPTKITHAIGGGYLIGGHSDTNANGDKTGIQFGGNDQWTLRTGCEILSPELSDFNFICEGEVIEVDATIDPCEGCIYNWEDGSNNPVRNISANTDAEYSLFVTHKDGCEINDTFNVEIVPNPTAIFLEVDSVTCYGDSDGAIYIDGVDGGSAPFVFDINGQIYDDVIDLPTFQNLQAGTFEISVEDIHGCTTDTTAIVEHPEQPLVVLPDDMDIELGDSVQIQALITPNIVDFQWTRTDGLSCTDCLDPYVAPQETFSVGLIVKDKNGCTAQDGVTLFISKDGGVYVPNAFSPNGDGDNEYLAVFTKNNIREIVDFSIYDRWGERVFSRQNFPGNMVQLGWDGRLRGQIMPRGVYVYSLTVERQDGVQETLYGNFTLVK